MALIGPIGQKRVSRDGKTPRVPSPFTHLLAKNIRSLRLEKRWTQAQLAKRAGVSQKTISRMEDGAINTRSEYHSFVAIALGTTAQQLCTGSFRDTGSNGAE